MTFVKRVLIFFAVALLTAALIWQFWLRDQLLVGNMGAAYAAKLVCSCRFVAERPMESCEQDFTADISALKITESTNEIRASAVFGAISAKARNTPGLGCALVER